MVVATEGLPQHMHGASTGIANTGGQVGTALGLAVFTAVAEMRTAALLNASPEIDMARTVGGYTTALAGVVVAFVGIAGLHRRSPAIGRRYDARPRSQEGLKSARTSTKTAVAAFNKTPVCLDLLWLKCFPAPLSSWRSTAALSHFCRTKSG